MTAYYFNNAVDTDLSNSGNWWLDDSFSVPAGGLPGPLDSGGTDTGISIESGAVACSMQIAGNVTISGGTFNEIVYSLDTTTLILGDPGATFNADITVGGYIFGGIFNGDIYWHEYAWLMGGGGGTIIINGTIHGQDSNTDLAALSTPDYPDVDDVRVGIEYGESQTGTLDLPAESDVRDGVTFDGETKEGTLGGGTITITVE